jgi:hypothetical protein
MIQFVTNDGGRAAAGYLGKTGDCVARAIAIASGRSYDIVYAELAYLNEQLPSSKHRRRRNTAGKRTAAHGIYTKSKSFKDYMKHQGFVWTPTMQIGSGCKVHVRENELPKGRLVLMLSKHCAAVIDGVLNDTYDCSRSGTRCVYGYYTFKGVG